MKLEIKKAVFYGLLDKVIKATDKDNDVFLVEVKEDYIKLTAMNNQTRITAKTKDFIFLEEGKAFLQCKVIYDLVKKLDDKELIELELIDNKLCVKQKRTKYNFIVLMDVEQLQQDHDLDSSVNVSRLDLVELLSTTLISASLKDTNPLLQSVNLFCKDNRLSSIATDSFRVSYNFLETVNNDFNVVIPLKSINDLLKIIEGSDVKISYSSAKIRFSFNDIEFESRLIEGQFPNLKTILNADYHIRANINRQSIIFALERSSVLLESLSTQIIKIDLGSNLATITAFESELGDLTEIIELKEKNGNDIKIGINYKYLLDALKTTSDEVVNICLNEPLKPIKIIGSGNLQHIILPVRI